jgi:hypothetical protein
MPACPTHSDELGARVRAAPERDESLYRQARTIPDHLVRTVTMPIFSKINAAMADELDLTFTSGRDPATTAQNLDTRIKTIRPREGAGRGGYSAAARAGSFRCSI